MTTLAPGSFRDVPDTLDVAGKHISGFRQLPPPVALSLRMRMLDAAHDCGCVWGAGAGSSTLAAYLAIALLLPFLRDMPNTFSWWWAIGAVFTGSLLGKAFGTFRAQRSLQTAIAEFNQLLATKS